MYTDNRARTSARRAASQMQLQVQGYRQTFFSFITYVCPVIS